VNVVLVTIDTLRVDRLGAGLTPALDRLADSGARFTSARSAAPLTLPSHTSILTGLLPPAHGVRENGSDTLADTHPTIARLLKNHGYQTAAFVGAFVLDRRFGLAQGFDTYDDRIPRDPNATERLEAERPASAVVDSALAWLASTQAPATTAPSTTALSTSAPSTTAPSTQHPFFVWIHLYDPHAPYAPPAEFLQRAKAWSSLTSHQSPVADDVLRYDGEIAYADSQIARVFDWLRAQRVIDRTLIVVAGDHGEGLGDHGERTHGMLLYDSTLRVPLIVAAPNQRAARDDDAVSLVDIAPTILHAAGATPPVEMKGRDLLDLVRLKPDATDQRPERTRAGTGSVRLQPDLYSETEYPRVAGWSPLQALTDGRWMTIRGASAAELYDLQSDPQELRDLAVAGPGGVSAPASVASVISAMTARLAALHTPSSAAHAVSAETAERLRSLGYVASAPQTARVPGAPNPVTRMDAWTRFEDALSALNARRREAVADLQRLAREDPDASVFATTYARALKDMGRAAAAVDIYRAAAKRWPTDGTLLHDLAVAAREASSAATGPVARALRDEAARAEQAALALSPGSAMAHNGLGLLAADEDRARDAAAEFERATAIDPNNAPYWTNLGNARRATGDRSGAEQAYRRAIDVAAGAADAANGLGVLLVEAGRAAEAVTWFERALAAAPDLVEARLNLGIARQQSGDAPRAADAYRAVLDAPGRHPRERDAAMKLLAGLGAAR
jgi:arylsulfatase A-like enzyme/tetratricopeptide (TPR) repeat protein